MLVYLRKTFFPKKKTIFFSMTDIGVKKTNCPKTYILSIFGVQKTSLRGQTVHFLNYMRIPQQRHSICSSFVLSFFWSFWQTFKKFKNLSLESKNTHTKLCAYPVYSLVMKKLLSSVCNHEKEAFNSSESSDFSRNQTSFYYQRSNLY